MSSSLAMEMSSLNALAALFSSPSPSDLFFSRLAVSSLTSDGSTCVTILRASLPGSRMFAWRRLLRMDHSYRWYQALASSLASRDPNNSSLPNLQGTGLNILSMLWGQIFPPARPPETFTTAT